MFEVFWMSHEKCGIQNVDGWVVLVASFVGTGQQWIAGLFDSLPQWCSLLPGGLHSSWFQMVLQFF